MGNNTRPIMKVARAVSEETGVPTEDLPPLHTVVDADCLNMLIETQNSGHRTFEYAGKTVTVYHTGEISVTDDYSVAPTK